MLPNFAQQHAGTRRLTQDLKNFIAKLCFRPAHVNARMMRRHVNLCLPLLLQTRSAFSRIVSIRRAGKRIETVGFVRLRWFFLKRESGRIVNMSVLKTGTIERQVHARGAVLLVPKQLQEHHWKGYNAQFCVWRI
jgi:hypothetical protein